MRLRLLPEEKQLGIAPYVWLVYLGIYLGVPFLDERTTPQALAVTCAGLVVFLPLYFLGYWLTGRPLVLLVAALMLLGTLIAPWNPSATVFFVYAAGYIGFTGEAGFATRLLLAQLAVVGLVSWALALPPSSWIPGVLFSAMVGAVNIHAGQMARVNARLRLAQDEVEQLARLAERERIARDLHDLLGHSLSLIVLKSELASKLLTRDPARAADELRDLERAAREALQEVRGALQGWRQGGFASELERAREALQAAGVDLDSQTEPVPLTAEQETVLALGLREAVTNVVRHARARSCRVRLGRAGQWALLEIHDDGRGGLLAEGLGLLGMRERLQALGGTLERSSAEGTRLRLTLPLDLPEPGGAPA